MNVLTRAEADIVEAMAEVFFPMDGPLGVSAAEAEVVAYVDGFIARLPRPEQVKIRALLQLLERGYAVRAMDPRARFSAATSDQQTDFLRELESSASPARRGVFQALRSMITIGYMEHPLVRRAMGAPGEDFRGLVTPEELAAATAAQPASDAVATDSAVEPDGPVVVAPRATADAAAEANL